MSSFLRDLPRLFPRPEQTIAGVSRLLRQREVSCVDILNACLEQVDEWEPKVHAWVVLDRGRAMERARSLDDELRSGKDRGPLHGIPIGIKDIIDVKGLPTACGAKRWAHRIAEGDAPVVEKLRGAGAIIMGKTVTTPYAWIDPPPTRNPWNLDRTPGGSSSGSAAAVACAMCYGAIGSQTGGSITRPATFCGVAGMKPAANFVSKIGVLPFAPSLDHIGPITRSVTDLRLLYEAIFDGSKWAWNQLSNAPRVDGPPRLGRLRGFFDRRLDASVRPLIDEVLRVLAGCGAKVVNIDDPVDFEQILVQHRTIMAAEAAETHSDWLDEFPEDYPPRIRELIEEGRPVQALVYLRALKARHAAMRGLFSSSAREDYDVLLTPATIGTAPDRTTTGDPAFNSPWSFCFAHHTVSVPVGTAPDGLPVAIQLIGMELSHVRILQAAEWCEEAIRTCGHRGPAS
jgi:aspartyl-tRNA(Asn)/glutamyl-tRNA(Gln) amidotransferase subunit A